jgi:protein translocase SEC61 complex gamma subunit
MDEKKSLADANIQQEHILPQAEPVEEKHAETKAVEPVMKEPSERKIDVKPPEHKTEEHPRHVKRRRISISKIASKAKILHPLHVKQKLSHYRVEYSRVLHLARKPTRSEYKELAIMVAIGTSIIGVIGFIVQMIIQFI